MAISSVLGSSALLPAGLGFRNVLINGDFKVWQRTTSSAITAASTTSYYADRWACYRGVTGSTISRQTAGLEGFQYCARLQRDSGNTATNSINIYQSLETVNSIPLAGKTVTISWYARAGANFSGSAMLVGINTGTGTDQNIYTGYTGNLVALDTTQAITTTWTRYTKTAILSSSATEVGLFFAYNPTGTAGANDYVEITGVQLEQNFQPTPFEQRPIGVELALCQRYYCVVASGSSFVGNAVMHTADAFESVIHLPTVMRTAPTLVATTGASYYGIYALNVTKRVDLLTNASNNLSNLRIYGSLVSTTSTAGVGAGLYLQSASASIAASSEL
jgi:hypothetical protein